MTSVCQLTMRGGKGEDAEENEKGVKEKEESSNSYCCTVVDSPFLSLFLSLSVLLCRSVSTSLSPLLLSDSLSSLKPNVFSIILVRLSACSKHAIAYC